MNMRARSASKATLAAIAVGWVMAASAAWAAPMRVNPGPSGEDGYGLVSDTPSPFAAGLAAAAGLAGISSTGVYVISGLDEPATPRSRARSGAHAAQADAGAAAITAAVVDKAEGPVAVAAPATGLGRLAAGDTVVAAAAGSDGAANVGAPAPSFAADVTAPAPSFSADEPHAALPAAAPSASESDGEAGAEDVSELPEPATVALVALALAGLAATRRPRR